MVLVKLLLVLVIFGLVLVVVRLMVMVLFEVRVLVELNIIEFSFRGIVLFEVVVRVLLLMVV